MPSPDLLSEPGDALPGAGDLLRGANELLRSAGEMVRGTDPLLDRASAWASEALSRLAGQAASQVTGCSEASATLWRDGEPAVFAASHPDLAELAGIEHRCGRSPWPRPWRPGSQSGRRTR
jgi:hypothetical protein